MELVELVELVTYYKGSLHLVNLLIAAACNANSRHARVGMNQASSKEVGNPSESVRVLVAKDSHKESFPLAEAFRHERLARKGGQISMTPAQG
eukprot:1159569-Pelagomonas_calceolata.AAC.2